MARTPFNEDKLHLKKKTPPTKLNKFDPDHCFDVVTKVLDSVTKESNIQEKVDINRIKKLRFSGLPFCSLRWFINLPKSVLGDFYSREFGFKYYTTVGHAVHDVFQTAMRVNTSVVCLNDFVCLSCKHRHVLLEESPEKCGKCGHRNLVSEEHEVLWNGAVGHVDEILLLDRDTRTVFIIDYKTTSLSSIDKKDSAQYKAQIISYAVALTDAGYNVVGVGLIYIPRDNPFKFRPSYYKITSKVIERGRKKLKFWKQHHDYATSISSLSEALHLIDMRPCRSEIKTDFIECEFASSCAGCDADRQSMEYRVRESYRKVKKVLPILEIK